MLLQRQLRQYSEQLHSMTASATPISASLVCDGASLPSRYAACSCVVSDPRLCQLCLNTRMVPFLEKMKASASSVLNASACLDPSVTLIMCILSLSSFHHLSIVVWWRAMLRASIASHNCIDGTCWCRGVPHVAVPYVSISSFCHLRVTVH